ncbi:glycoside hydrolase family 28 protein [Clostridium akagii]|uniref:glycoside hydrolase family 28 protein n=1 Tax=Clostridium akagii TaxID=91623 RepID=UPI000AD2AB72|nr:glycoside hydrolase family 28 protein [Clostridium akagii]
MKNGIYWNEDLYKSIEKSVMLNRPNFDNKIYFINDDKYSKYILDTKEQYFVTSERGDIEPTCKEQLVKDYTHVFKAAIEECYEKGGGTVKVSSGIYYTGAITLKSGVNLELGDNSVIKFIRNKTNAFYPIVNTFWEGIECYNFSPFIYAINEQNIAITGSGIIDGQADYYNWMPWKYGHFGQENQQIIREKLFKWAENGFSVKKRILSDEVSTLRPSFLETVNCKNILIEGISIINSPMWEIHPCLSENILIKGVKIKTLYYNNDGIDPEFCKNVIIEDCEIDTGDDCIAIKSGRNNDGRRINVPSENIIIRNNMFKAGHGGITIGSEVAGGVKNIFAEKNIFHSKDLDYPLRIKTNSVRGGTIENIYVRDSIISKAKIAVIHATMNYEENDIGEFTPIIKNIFLSNIKTSIENNINAENGIFLEAYNRSPIKNVYIKDSELNGVKNTIHVKNIENIKFENVKINGEICSINL